MDNYTAEINQLTTVNLMGKELTKLMQLLNVGPYKLRPETVKSLSVIRV